MDASWTTVHLAAAALKRGHGVRFVEPWDFEVDGTGQATARVHAFDPGDHDVDRLVRSLQDRSAPRRYIRLDRFDVLLLRAAPFDPTIMAFALMAKSAGVRVVNDPAGLMVVSHKAWLAALPGVARPTTLVTQSPGMARLFYEKYRVPCVVKPARGSGGRDVFLVPWRDVLSFNSAFSRAMSRGGHVVVQTYLQEATEGEKRLVWMDGVVLGGYLRTRAPGEFRHNLKQGGTAQRTDLTAEEFSAVDMLSPHLLELGIRLAGIDLIGGHVIEVNALNPGGAFHTDRLSGTDTCGAIVERLATTTTQPEKG